MFGGRSVLRSYKLLGIPLLASPLHPLFAYGLSTRAMGKKKNNTPPEEHLLLPVHPSRADSSESDHTPTVDTHTHLVSTFNAYQTTYKPGKHETIWDFVRGMYHGRRVEAIVDVWCEAPPLKAQWKDIADSALESEQREKQWGGIEYWFVMGAYSPCTVLLTCLSIV